MTSMMMMMLHHQKSTMMMMMMTMIRDKDKMIGKGRGLVVESRLTDMARTVGTSKGVGQL